MGTKLKMIKKDASVDIKIGAGFLQKIQKIMFYIASGVTPEQVEQYKAEAEKFTENSEFSEEWMEHLNTISILIREIEAKATEQGFTYEEDIDNIMPEED
jgi:hypothetical protein